MAEHGARLGPGEHVIQFYEGDDSLAFRVSRYLTAAIAAGGIAIIIATEERRQAVEAHMALAGVDIARAWSEGSLLVSDAPEGVESLLAGGDRPDPALFERMIGGLVRYATRRGVPVCAYGEMVALLWEAGYIPAAIELEKLWNGLHRQHLFSHFCGYPRSAVTGDEHIDAFHDLCRLHSRVV